MDSFVLGRTNKTEFIRLMGLAFDHEIQFTGKWDGDKLWLNTHPNTTPTVDQPSPDGGTPIAMVA